MSKLFKLLAIIFCGILNAQTINGKIISKENNSAIPFARIGIENENFGAIADEKGNYSIDLTNVDQNKNITVQVGGFENFSQSVQNFISGNHIISLNEKVVDIQEVKLNPKRYSEKNWGTNAKTKKVQFGFNPARTKEDKSKEFGVYFNNNKKLKIQKININIVNLKTDKPLLISFNVYSEKNGLPDNSLLSENLTVQLTEADIKAGTFTFDISKRNVWISKQNFFVSMQVINNFDGWIYLSGALFKTVYYRSYYDRWEKRTIAQPSLNIDVKIEK
ncbi:carboxypeptidase-like regulatory domain-containing protein [Chryseobacterium arthrosphaerae]|uniref:carboxypeptidase-like regulatory domain-containing protein n=1 Tax=Chryseobacterium arthrosphaerae TaxID=651561 RepID=UPI0023E3216A|nr:carboxypeptidase-like regulatory domain-containing protein [Chryseobacterium arthrosphaerae]WES97115.1 carboxypeptidase-like regulatory domain-containing protein [Chryseobacterium arthrosphaerae]